MINGLTPDTNKHIKREYKSVKISPVVWILLVVLLFASLGVTIVGGVIVARDFAMNTDMDEFMEDVDEFVEKCESMGFYHRWVYYDHHGYRDWVDYHDDWADEFEESMDDFADDMEDFADDIEDIVD